MQSISTKDVLRQLKADLIGKDSYRGVTLTYTWLANQFGHFSLGFIPTLIVYAIIKHNPAVHQPSVSAAFAVSITWLLFETYNFLGPLLLNKKSTSNHIFVPEKKYTFEPAWLNIAFDTITDLSFFWLGAFSASLFLLHVPIVVHIIIALLLILIYPCHYWFLTKMYLQYAQYPVQFRLSQWSDTMNDANKKVIEQFLDNKTEGKHLFVFGGRRCGKTLLSVGLATEFSIKHKNCCYTTAMKLYNLFSESEADILKDDNALWSWRTASLLVIDDINPGDPINDIVTPAQFLTMLDCLTGCNNENRKIFKNENVIWVMGNMEDQETNCIDDWKQMLKTIGVNPDNILSVNLGFQNQSK